jgi:formate hydrogenlyase transcriptional activator
MTSGSASASARDAILRYEALLRVSSTLAGHKTVAELFHVLADRLHKVVPFDYLALVLHDPATDEMRLVVLEPSDMPTPSVVTMPVSAHGPAGVVWSTQQPAVIPIRPEGPLVPALQFIREQGRTITCWLPLTTVHRRVGVLSFGSCDDVDYTPDAIAFMEQVAATVAIAVDNAINFDRAREAETALRSERDRLRLLLDVNNLLITEHNYSSLVTAVSQALRPVVEHDHLSIVLPDQDAQSPDADATRAAQRWPSSCSVPLATRRGPVGTMIVASNTERAFTADDVELLHQVSAQIAVAVENALTFGHIVDANDHLEQEKHYLEEEVRFEYGFDDIVGTSAAWKRVLKAVQTVAPTDATVLLLGETGTGKEMVARAIHNLSARRHRSFVRLNVAALPAGLIESELFGYEKGAFTGAVMGRLGRLELAERGSLFLDEVGDVPVELQPKLLRVLQERELERLGSGVTRRVDVRMIAATHRDLPRMIEDGAFRSDLYYRLNVFPIPMPPLRERLEDIPLLAQHFAQKFGKRLGRRFTHISDSGMAALRQWQWPGNVRELENVIERAAILSPGPELLIPVADLQMPTRSTARTQPPTLRDAEREAILLALRESNGVIAGPSGAAARLGLNRTTLQSMMRRLGIRRPSF